MHSLSFTQIYQWALSELNALASAPDIRAALQMGNTAHRLEFVVDALRGVAAGSLPSTQPAQLALLRASMAPLATLQRAVMGNVLHTTMVFELAGDLLEAQQTQLQPSDAGQLVEWVVQLLASYGSHRGGQVSLSVHSAAQAAEAVDEVREELAAVLRLLTQLLQRDVVSLEPDACAHVAKVCVQVRCAAPGPHAGIPVIAHSFPSTHTCTHCHATPSHTGTVLHDFYSLGGAAWLGSHNPGAHSRAARRPLPRWCALQLACLLGRAISRPCGGHAGSLLSALDFSAGVWSPAS